MQPWRQFTLTFKVSIVNGTGFDIWMVSLECSLCVFIILVQIDVIWYLVQGNQCVGMKLYVHWFFQFQLKVFECMFKIYLLFWHRHRQAQYYCPLSLFPFYCNIIDFISKWTGHISTSHKSFMNQLLQIYRYHKLTEILVINNRKKSRI